MPEHLALPEPSDPRARELIRCLGLAGLPGESGYIGFIGRSSLPVLVEGRTLAAQSQVYYLLTREVPVNFLHRVASDDTHVLVEGGPVDYFVFPEEGPAERVTLGRDHAAGERLVLAVPAGAAKALKLREGAAYALMVNVLSPAWTEDRVTIGAGPEFVQRHERSAPWATPALLRELIGPNFRP
jgi:predicted cupin superfamily sugar epimerase